MAEKVIAEDKSGKPIPWQGPSWWPLAQPDHTQSLGCPPSSYLPLTGLRNLKHLDLSEFIRTVVFSIQIPQTAFLKGQSPNNTWASDHSRYKLSLAEVVLIFSSKFYHQIRWRIPAEVNQTRFNHSSCAFATICRWAPTCFIDPSEFHGNFGTNLSKARIQTLKNAIYRFFFHLQVTSWIIAKAISICLCTVLE